MLDSYEEISPVEENIPPVLPDEPVELSPKKRHFVPYLLLAVLFTLGICAFFFLPNQPQVAYDPATPWFTVEEGTLFFHPEFYAEGSTLVVPQQIAGQTVTRLADNCFANCSGIITVELPGTLKAVGNRAFANCPDLRGVLLPEGVTTVGADAFRSCGALESLCIPYTIETLGSNAFGNCPKLEHIFFTGPLAVWKIIYPHPISEDTTVYALDGNIRQSEIAQ